MIATKHEAKPVSGRNGWVWMCSCGASAKHPTVYEDLSKRGATAHMSSERRKARYAEAATR